MYKHLYDQFAHWFHDGKGTVYFYSDPHFNDDEMKHLRKNYIGDDEQVRRINSKIGKYDTLVILGDVGDIEWVRKIRGYKVLVMGNHDKGATKYKRRVNKHLYYTYKYTKEEAFNAAKELYPPFYKLFIEEVYATTEEYGTDRYWQVTADDGLFDEVYEGALMIAPNIILSHEPIDFPYAMNIHGHIHNTKLFGRTFEDRCRHYNVCAELIDYTPVPLSFFIKHGFKEVVNIHRETIDRAVSKR